MRATVVIPTFNEAENLPRLVKEIRTAVPGIGILVVDDASPDGTADLADALGRDLGGIDVLRRRTKDGLGAAYPAQRVETQRLRAGPRGAGAALECLGQALATPHGLHCGGSVDQQLGQRQRGVGGRGRSIHRAQSTGRAGPRCAGGPPALPCGA